MHISTLVTPARVVANLSGTTLTEALTTLANLLAYDLKQTSAQEILDILLERERLGSTANGKGYAIPHGRLAALAHPIAALGRSSQGIACNALDGEPVYLVIALLSPLVTNDQHICALSAIVRPLRRTTLRNRLREISDPALLYHTLITEEEH